MPLSSNTLSFALSLEATSRTTSSAVLRVGSLAVVRSANATIMIMSKAKTQTIKFLGGKPLGNSTTGFKSSSAPITAHFQTKTRLA